MSDSSMPPTVAFERSSLGETLRQIPWEPSTTHANGHVNTNGHAHADEFDPLTSSRGSDDSTRNPAIIFLYTFLLTTALTLSTLLALYLAIISSPSWRLPFFLSSLSLFHILEYSVTAQYNPTIATTTAFLLNNGKAYNIAHCLAFLECALHLRYAHWISTQSAIWITVIGLVLMVMGQGVRTAGMVTAGSNFNHIVQSEKKSGHVLVIGGVYAWLRHPSYFGFFWWGLGTQLVLGNAICLIGYAVVLWRFFRRRIESEEEFLVGFFGLDYVRYRRRTRVAIPFIP